MVMAAPPSGERIYALKSAQRLGRVNMIAGDRNQQLIAPFTITGACNRVVFEIWLETCLIPTLRARDWVVIDNATFSIMGVGLLNSLTRLIAKSSTYRPIRPT